MSDSRPSAVDPERLFVDFLRQGPDADLESWCRRHSVHAPRLRALHQSYQTVVGLLRDAGISLSGLPEHPTPSLSASSSSTSHGLLRRIIAQGPKGSRLRIQGEIARGGMGAILRVRDDDLGRDLAMKVVLGRERGSDPSSVMEERALARFLEEAQITGQLEHPGVVPVHEVGLDAEGRVYFTMRLVKGRNLEEVFRLAGLGRDGWSRTRALGVLLRVCEAMAYAHSRGVVHRDLKPTNVMVGSFGEVYVMDWGLAHAARAEAAAGPSGASDSVRTARGDARVPGQDPAMATLHGEVLGTPSYMPPEQARGAHHLVSTRADVYAVGAMLYHLLAQRPPYARAGGERLSDEVLEELLRGPPPPVRDFAPDLPDELVAITETAMAREIDARYAGMLELGHDLRAYLEGRVVRAHQTGTWVELRKWVGRNRALSAAAAAALVFLVAGLAASLWQRGIALGNAALAAEREQDALANAALAAERAAEAGAQRALAEERALAAAAAAHRAEIVRDFLSELLANANPTRSMQGEVLVADVLADAAVQLDAGTFADDIEAEYALRATLGDAFQGVSRLAESEREYRRALALFEQRSTREPLERIALEGELADTLAARGRHDEVERSARARLEELERLGSGDHERVRALRQLAFARYSGGDTGAAIELARAALSIQERHAADDDPAPALTRAKLAFYLSRDGRFDEALTEADRAIEALDRGSPQERFEATEAMRTRSLIHQSRRENQGAIADLQRGLAIRRELFSGDGLYVANFEADLGLMLNAVGRPDEGEPLLRHALEIRRRVLGEHVDTATLLVSLAVLRGDRGDLIEARALHLEALEMRLRLLGPDSPAVGDSKARLGRLAMSEGDPQRAEAFLREALANWEAALGADHPDVSAVWYYLGTALRAQGRLDEARQALERALALQEPTFGIDGPVTRDTRDEWYRLLLEQQEFEPLLVALREARARVTNQVGPMSAYLGALQGAALAGLGRYEEAEPLLLEGWRVMGPDERLWTVNKLAVLDALVAFYLAVEDPEQADVYRELAAALRN
jgi:serine/threonine protein kinase